MACCELYDERYGCPEEICPGCYLEKEHDKRHCSQGCTCVYDDCSLCRTHRCYMCGLPATGRALTLIGEHWYCEQHEHYAAKYEKE